MASIDRRVVRSPEDLGQHLARLRFERGLTQAELADELGITRRYVWEIESGRPNLFARRLFEIVRTLDAELTLGPAEEHGRERPQ